MLTLTSAQLETWLALLIWPFARVLALVASAPVTGNPQFPVRAKIGLAVLIAVLVAPLLPAMPAPSPASGAGLLLLARETLIGMAMGFALRLIFTAVEMAGDVVGLQMGLGFAQIYDPQSSAHVPVIGQFLGLIATLAFLALNGHLMIVSALVDSLQTLPPGDGGTLAVGGRQLAQWGGTIFAASVLLALPLIATLMITNAALGVLSRAASQLNVFAVGFPITLAIGFAALFLVLPYLGAVFERLFAEGLQAMTLVIHAGAPSAP